MPGVVSLSWLCECGVCRKKVYSEDVRCISKQGLIAYLQRQGWKRREDAPLPKTEWKDAICPDCLALGEK